jgi:hypothetical protein
MDWSKLDFAMLWPHLVGATAALLGIPDVVLHAAAQWARLGCHAVFAALDLTRYLRP